MKKILTFILFFCALPAFCADTLMFIHPFRETILNFPTSTLQSDGLVVTVFLPEAALPLRQKYPVVYVLGATPKEAQAARELAEEYAQKAILVGINLTPQQLQEAEKVNAFISRELVPYVDTNYPTLAEASARAVAAEGAAGGKVLASLLAKKNLFTKAVLLNGGHWPVSLAGAAADLRILLAGKQNHIAVWQQTLLDKNMHYGPGYAVKLTAQNDLLPQVDLDYLFAPQEQVMLKKMKAQITPTSLSVAQQDRAKLSVTAHLENKRVYDYVPLSLRQSPHYLDYNAEQGILRPISGAVPGKVKISHFAGKKKFQTKIRLKK